MKEKAAIKKKNIFSSMGYNARHSMTGYLFLAPFIAFFVVFIVFPILQATALSFTQFNLLQPAQWRGLFNYRVLLTEDDIFLIALKNTFTFALVVGPLGYIISFLFAWVLNQLKFRTGFALAFYAPSITSGVAMSVVWLVFFSNDRYGWINNFLINTGIIQTPIMWVSDPRYILSVIIIIQLWMSMGTSFLVFLAGLQNISKELYDAAAVDGISNKFQELIYVTLPSMKPQLLFGAISAIVGSFGVFEIAVAVAGMPSPDYAAHTIVAHLYDMAFIKFEMGYASAVAVMLFLITYLLGKFFMKILASD